MKILWFSHRDIENPRAGGAERTSYEIGRALVSMGHEFTICSARSKGATRSELEGIRLHRYPSSLGPHLAALPLMRRLDPDVVVADLAHVVPWPEPLFAGRKVVVCFRHLHARTLSGQVSGPASTVLRRVELEYRRVYPRSLWVTESISASRDLVSLGIHPSKIRRIPPGIDSKLFAPRPKSTFPTLVYFGGLRAYKRPELVLELYTQLRSSNRVLQLRIVGSGPSLPGLKGLAAKLGSERDGISFLGRVEYESLPEIIGSSWVNVHTSVAEGWCYSVTEAASSGTPTVAFKVPGVDESVLDGVTGLLVPGSRITDLVDRARRLLAEHESFGRRARALSEQRDWIRVARDWESVLLDARNG